MFVARFRPLQNGFVAVRPYCWTMSLRRVPLSRPAPKRCLLRGRGTFLRSPWQGPTRTAVLGTLPPEGIPGTPKSPSENSEGGNVTARVEVQVRNIKLSDRIREHVDERAGRMDHYLPALEQIDVELTHHASARQAEDRNVAQITARGKGLHLAC